MNQKNQEIIDDLGVLGLNGYGVNYVFLSDKSRVLYDLISKQGVHDESIKKKYPLLKKLSKFK